MRKGSTPSAPSNPLVSVKKSNAECIVTIEEPPSVPDHSAPLVYPVPAATIAFLLPSDITFSTTLPLISFSVLIDAFFYMALTAPVAFTILFAERAPLVGLAPVPDTAFFFHLGLAPFPPPLFFLSFPFVLSSSIFSSAVVAYGRLQLF